MTRTNDSRAPCIPAERDGTPGPGLLKAASSAAASPSDATAQGAMLPPEIDKAIHALTDAHRAAEGVGEYASIAEHRGAIVACDDAYCSLAKAIRAALSRERLAREQAEAEVKRWEGKEVARGSHCSDMQDRASAAEQSAERMAAMFGAFIEAVHHEDGGLCHLCGAVVDDETPHAFSCPVIAARAALSAYEAERAGKGTR